MKTPLCIRPGSWYTLVLHSNHAISVSKQPANGTSEQAQNFRLWHLLWGLSLCFPSWGSSLLTKWTNRTLGSWKQWNPIPKKLFQRGAIWFPRECFCPVLWKRKVCVSGGERGNILSDYWPSSCPWGTWHGRTRSGWALPSFLSDKIMEWKVDTISPVCSPFSWPEPLSILTQRTTDLLSLRAEWLPGAPSPIPHLSTAGVTEPNSALEGYEDCCTD